MAFDKAVDSARLNADLSLVADAIRNKSGSAAPLIFPAGFVSAVSAIPGVETETLTYVPSVRVHYFDVTNPRAETPKLVVASTDPAGCPEGMATIYVAAVCSWPGLSQGTSGSRVRYPTAYGRVLSDGTVKGGSGAPTNDSSSAFGTDGSIRIGGGSSSDQYYGAGQTYVIKLYYWEDT